MSHNNEKILKDGLRRAQAAIESHLIEIMRSNVITLLHNACFNRGFTGFTGNTQTSYTGGIYLHGKLVDVITQNDYTEPPRRLKVPKGKWVYLKHPYEGGARSVYGKANVDKLYGQDTSIRFLRTYSAPKNFIAIVITTGTEYSEYIEGVAHLDVLTRTWEDAGRVLLSSMRPISA